ncbi:DMT family transporter [Nevskia sp.]|uniref:DMT family transporter n=1 Tax=Nevskia sp. TaxID=1929292 RepID=UPI0025E1F5FF|nr:DMT family transporter [Nevskia sp.]
MNFGIGEFYSLACALVWAVAVVLFKKSGESIGPFALNLFKNTLAAVLLGITVFVISPEVPDFTPLSLGLIGVSGLLGICFGDSYYLRALNSIGASRMAVAQTLFSPFVIVLSAIFLRERLHGLQWLGAAFVLGGIVLVTWTRDAAMSAVDARRLRTGAALGVLSVLLMAIGIVMAKPMLALHAFLWVVWLRVLAGVAGLLVVIAIKRNAGALLAEYRAVRHWPQMIAGSLAGTYLSMMLWLAGYKYTSASVAAVLNETAAVFIVLLAVVFLHEKVGRRQVIGIAFAMFGVSLMVLS